MRLSIVLYEVLAFVILLMFMIPLIGVNPATIVVGLLWFFWRLTIIRYRRFQDYSVEEETSDPTL